MRNIVVQISISLDGYIEGPNRDISWAMISEEVHADVNEFLAPMSAFLMGRVTYELLAAFWPTADADPNSTPAMLEFAGIWRKMPRVVYSRTLEDVDSNSTIVREVIPEEVRALKAQPGGDMSLGGPNLAASFLRHGLIDEFRIYVHPVAIGAGTALFPAGVTVDLDLLESRTFANGVVLLYYAVR